MHSHVPRTVPQVDADSRLPSRFFYTVTHKLLVSNLEAMWEAYKPHKVENTRSRYGEERGLLNHRARVQDEATEALLNSDVLFSDSEDVYSPTPCPTPAEYYSPPMSPSSSPYSRAGGAASESSEVPESSRLKSSARAIRSLLARRAEGRRKVLMEARRIHELVFDIAPEDLPPYGSDADSDDWY